LSAAETDDAKRQLLVASAEADTTKVRVADKQTFLEAATKKGAKQYNSIATYEGALTVSFSSAGDLWKFKLKGRWIGGTTQSWPALCQQCRGGDISCIAIVTK